MFFYSKSIIVLVTTARPGFLYAWVLLTKVYTNLNLFDEAQQASMKAYKLNQSFNSNQIVLKEILDELSMCFLSNSRNEQHWVEALNLYSTVCAS